MKIGLHVKVVEVTELTGAEIAALRASGMETIGDLLMRKPRRYEDRRRFDTFPQQADSLAVCLKGMVVMAGARFAGAGKKFHEVVIEEQNGGVFGSGRLTCRWFNMPFLSKAIAVGHEVIVYGKVKEAGGRLLMDHPEFEVIREEASSIHLERIVPIHRNVPGIPQRRLREIIHTMLGRLDAPAASPLDATVNPAEALRALHFPHSLKEAEAAACYFALEEFFKIQLNALWRRANHKRKAGRSLGRKTTLLKRFHASLPFELTGSQKRAIHEVAVDMRSEAPMNRLLQGDVGAGKTFVAMAAMLLAVDSGCQAALMAPTQILAEQHYLTFRQWLDPLGVKIALCTANRNERNHAELEGKDQVVIGTHALLQGRDLFNDLGLVVIDEQHKFGVNQRLKLIDRGRTPDVLVMTATPIPRTLAMTLYGDLDVSILDQKPAGRGKIITALRVKAKQPDITSFVKDQLHLGRQAYLVYPWVEESGSKSESAVEAFDKWRKRLAGFEVGLVHGKMDASSKDETMTAFRAGRIHALVATSVIEVGVDVPNANLMILHQAERYGLAQLHQLRGRIGRGEAKSYCILLSDGKNPDALKKLAILESTSDGFEIAEADLRLRGPGDVLGTVQSGMSQLRFAEYLANPQLLNRARDLAEKTIREDPMLNSDHRFFRDWIDEAFPVNELPSA